MSDFTLSMIRAFLHRLPSAYDLNKLRIIQRKRAKIKADKAKTRALEPSSDRNTGALTCERRFLRRVR